MKHDLIYRHKIRDDQIHNIYNKMTDLEIKEFEEDIGQQVTQKRYEHYRSAVTAKIIDTEIIHNLLAIGNNLCPQCGHQLNETTGAKYCSNNQCYYKEDINESLNFNK